ncbi:N-acetyltransferase [Pleurocapsa sp. CCALA 161]|uniref:GNAT family N-acetyltransferase n=1 Tax=Pleurocapsa sp. CCALA 161 TaxID=2107688 RepID=UPI000D06E4B0|nr:GNAT family N-acetyltransferase [Pleurocapsa sp. CCALA 161]PSB07400.1 N-acetyltransferase [Pleurocapsa sp. CCALA 161]
MILKTQRLTLQPILESECNTLQMIFTDPHVRKYLCDDTIFSWQQVEEMLKQSRKYFEEEKFGLWFIRINGESEVIGFVGLWYFFDEKQPQLIYAILPKALKKGYATEAATRIIKYCFDELGYEYILASCDQPNLESKKVAERLGMRRVEEKIVKGNLVVFFRLEKS